MGGNITSDHAQLNEWIEQIAALTKPDAIHLCDGSVEEYDTLAQVMVDAGSFTRLNQELRPNSYLCRSDPADVALISAQNRKKKLLVSDMDSTIIPVECIDEVADFAGVRDECVAITEPAMRGEMSFEDYIEWRVKEDLHLQSSFIFDTDGTQLVDYVGRFENLSEDLAQVCATIGLDTSLPHENASKRSKYQDYYNDHTRDLVAEAFAADIEAFGYEFD